MLSFAYQFFLLFFGVLALCQQRVKGKYKKQLLSKIGLKLPKIKYSSNEKVFWIHAVSLGESKAARGIIAKLKKKYPKAKIVLSTITETGLKEGKGNPNVDIAFFLPLDLSWTMRRLMKRINPSYIFLIENDVWYQFLQAAKNHGAIIHWISAKLSEKSARRYRFFRFFSKRIFMLFDKVIVQNELYKDRFSLFVNSQKLHVGGDLKFDNLSPKIPIEKIDFWRKKLHLNSSDTVISLSCTHDPEEKQILEKLLPVLNKHTNVKVLLAPRHPERFAAIEKLLISLPIPIGVLSDLQTINKNTKIILINTIGFLPICYQLSKLAILGGSFIPKIGGHNILEPCQAGIPVIFGPYMESQKALEKAVLEFDAGEVATFQSIEKCLENYLDKKEIVSRKKGENARALCENLQGSLDNTWNYVFNKT